ncbi:hypothetical protein DENSPDRAFT_842022 [Dentipellis sp. KUC8613]|nr:hypothetical protein DENSPDRAFT_842022 [Dentipellis sp. KUC8613]
MQALPPARSEPPHTVDSGSHFFSNLMNLWRYAGVHTTETYLYGAISHLFATFSLGCRHADEDVFIFSHPQNEFRGCSLTKSSSRRFPDFAILGTVKQMQNADEPGYREPFLAFWVEVKPFQLDSELFTEDNRARTALSIRYHLAQVSEQAYLALQHHKKKRRYAFLITGCFFTLLLYTAADHEPVVESVKLPLPSRNAVPVTPRQAKKRGAPSSLSPTTSQLLGRRQKMRKIVSASPNKNPVPAPAPAPAGGIPPIPSLEAASQIPEIIYFNENIVDFRNNRFEPRFLKALQLAMENIDVTYEDPSFVCPPGDYPPTEGSLEMAQEAIDEAFASAPEASLSSGPDSPASPVSLYHPSPEQGSSISQPTPLRAPLTRRRAQTLESSAISSAVQMLMNNGMDRLTAIGLASDNEAATAQLAGEDIFSTVDDSDLPAPNSSRATGSYRNSFHEALVSSSSSSGSPYVFDDRLLAAAETDASSDMDPVPSSDHSSDVDNWSSEQEFDSLDESTSADIEASADGEKSARYVSRKGKERAF